MINMEEEIAWGKGLDVSETSSAHNWYYNFLHKHKREKKCDKSHNIYKHLFLGVSLALILLFACVGLASAATIYVATDGSGDYNCDGTDDHIEINWAIDNASSGDVVHLNASTYSINDSINLASNIIFEGDSEDTTILRLQNKNNRANWQLIRAFLINNATLQNFTLNGNSGNQTGLTQNSGVLGIWFGASDWITARNITVRNIYTDSFYIGSLNDDSDIRNCSVYNGGHDGFVITATSYRNTIADSLAWNVGAHGVRIYNSGSSVIERNSIYAGDYGIYIDTQGSCTRGNNIIRDNYINNRMFGDYAAIAIEAEGATTILNETVTGNIVDTANTWSISAGVYVFGTGTIGTVNITNNVFYDCGSGIYAKKGTVNAKNNIITDCGFGVYAKDSGTITSTYNDVWNNVNDYYENASAGTGDISLDPLFYDVSNHKFYLNSTIGTWNGLAWEVMVVDSPCIDAGDPTDDYSDEPAPNGNRINMGAYGNTVDASKSPGAALGTISGIVNDTNNTPISEAIVAADLYSNVTNSTGWYSLTDILEGNYLLIASKNGYYTSCKPIAVIAGETTTVNITLNLARTPATNVTRSPPPDANGWNNATPVVVTFFRSDNSSGINYTNYSKISETGPWTTVDVTSAFGIDAENVSDITEDTFNVTVTDEGVTNIWYYSVDNNATNETVKNVTVKIDTKPRTDLVGEWHFDEGSGVTAEDTSGNNNDGILTNMDPATDWVNGKLGKALSFDGADSYVDCGNNANLDITDKISILLWLKPNVVGEGGPNAGPVCKAEVGVDWSWQLRYNAPGGGNYMGFQFNGDPEGSTWVSVKQNLSPGEWYHIAGTFDGTTLKCYLNGIDKDTTQISAIKSGNSTLFIGQDGWGNIFNGVVDEVKIYNKALSSAEIQADYEAAGLEDTTPPSTISNLQHTGGQTWINWMWTNPPDEDFSHVMVYLDGIWKINTSDAYYNATDLAAETSYGISTLTVDTHGNVNTNWVNQTAATLAVPNSPPVAVPNGPYAGTEGVPTTFDGSASYDPDGSIISYEWDFGDGDAATVPKPTHTYIQDGSYTVILTVTDNDGAAGTNATTATIADTGPTAEFSASSTTGPEPLTVSFSDSSTSYDNVTAWDWDFENDDAIDSTEQNPTYLYAEEGTYTVTLTIYETDGNSDTLTKVEYIIVTSVNQPPLAVLDVPETGTEGIPITVDGSASYDPDGSIISYYWNFGDENSSSSSEVKPTHNYALDGSYTVTLTVTDNEGATNATNELITIQPAANPVFSITITSPESRTYASTSVRMNVAVQPEGTVLDWIAYSLDSGTNVTTIPDSSSTTTINGIIGAGDHTLVVYARDGNGNVAASNTINFTLQPGDINGDTVINILDLQLLAWAFASQPGDTNWNEAADLNCDDKINILDYQIVAWNLT